MTHILFRRIWVHAYTRIWRGKPASSRKVVGQDEQERERESVCVCVCVCVVSLKTINVPAH